MRLFHVVTLPPAALPRRPLTVGELLDAAAQLVRRRAWVLLPLAAVLAVAEQILLVAARRELGIDFIYGFNGDFASTIAALWVVLALGCGTEAFIIVTLGILTGRAAAEDLAGAAPPLSSGRWKLLVPRWRNVLSVMLVAPIAAVLSAAGAFFGPMWVLGYALFGLAGVVIGMEHRGPLGGAGRSAAYAFRNGMRATWVRVLGYFAWAAIRLGFLFGITALSSMLPVNQAGQWWILTGGLVVANAAAYVFLAALDAATLAEGRFRSEGLDIWLSRAEHHGPLTPAHLAARP